MKTAEYRSAARGRQGQKSSEGTTRAEFVERLGKTQHQRELRAKEHIEGGLKDATSLPVRITWRAFIGLVPEVLKQYQDLGWKVSEQPADILNEAELVLE